MANSFRRSRLGQKATQVWEENEGTGIALAWVALVLLGALALKLAVINVAPYLVILGQSPIKPSGTPLIGWLLDALSLVVFGLGALLLWGAVNGLQLLWILITLDKVALRAAIKASHANSQSVPQATGRPGKAERKARRKLAGLPFFFLRFSGFLALGAFVLDGIVNLLHYPPVKSWSAFWAGSAIGDFSAVDLQTLMMFLFSLFSTEVLAVAIAVVFAWIVYHQEGVQP